MRKLIRSKATKAFLTKGGAWTNDFASAAVFADQSAAATAKSHFALHDVELYYSFDDHEQSQWDFALHL